MRIWYNVENVSGADARQTEALQNDFILTALYRKEHAFLIARSAKIGDAGVY